MLKKIFKTQKLKELASLLEREGLEVARYDDNRREHLFAKGLSRSKKLTIRFDFIREEEEIYESLILVSEIWWTL